MTKKKSKLKDAPSQGEGYKDKAAATEYGQTNTNPSRQDVMSDVRAQREARHAQQSKHYKNKHSDTSPATPNSYVRKSSLYFSVLIALTVGVMLGTLLPVLSSAPVHTGVPAQSAEQAAAQAAEQARQQEQKVAELAPHILEMEGAVRKDPKDVQAWIQLGNLYFDAGKAMQSINAYERALILKPNNVNVLTDLGIMYREAAQYELAVQSFRKATQIDPKHEKARFNTGVVLYFDLQRKDEAFKAWQDLLAMNPKATTPDGHLLKDMLRSLK